MTCYDTVTCFHEPFGDSFYYGPERVSPTHMHDEVGIKTSGFEKRTYDVVLCNILDHVEVSEAVRLTIFDFSDHVLCSNYAVRTLLIIALQNGNKRVFIKDIAYHIVSPIHTPVAIAPSLSQYDMGPVDTTTPNPSILPCSVLSRFQFTFLIRDPRTAIPSLYRCTVPPLNEKTGMQMFLTSEIGYRELRLLLDYLYANDAHGRDNVCLIDADDLLENPAGIVRAYCQHVDLPFSKSMLSWGSDEDQARAVKAFAKFYGYHEDAIESTGMIPSSYPGRHYRSTLEDNEQWRSEYGEEGAAKIRKAVDDNMADYKYLKQFALQPLQ